jgi:chemotaxis protein histidine kinase CheA
VPQGIKVIYRDDGRGLNLIRIREKAAEKRISTDDRSADEIAELIFKPGFSTATNVTDISGRGIGMDAIRNFLEEQGGDIAIKLTKHEISDAVPFSFEILVNLHFGEERELAG